MVFIISEIILVLYSFRISFYRNNADHDILYKSNCSTKFLVVIPAHNEAMQIEKVIHSIRKVNYPQNLIDIILLNDCCTDKTVEIACSEGIEVYNFTEKANTKGEILKSFCQQNRKIIDNYDYFCIADADMVFDKDFFAFGDNNFKNGYKIVQGQINSIQYKKNIVSYFMAAFQQIICSFMFYQNKLGNSAIVCGKGVLITPDVIECVGWNENLLLEDVSFSFDALLKGYKIHYSHQMKIGTKHPYTVFDLWIQQRRWTTGQIQIIKKYHSYILDKRINGTARTFVFVGYINIIIFCFMAVSVLEPIIYVLIAVSLYVCSFFISLIILHNQNVCTIGTFLTFPFLIFYWHLIFLSSLLKPEKKWKQIKNK